VIDVDLLLGNKTGDDAVAKARYAHTTHNPLMAMRLLTRATKVTP